ncbi:shikimate dehydrogenase [Opitutus sp. ER46]|uniref:shikimate dehydrogenase n=1 Tax=Opitutus sp. ER46 TaxID=2161864 RepID=UPI000D30EED4|nr:shikimate dehydrogenase [Opitutus sp. ER46]PTX91353.1 shikimate dehydrogenase [Opitutus sp. ER46]
MAATPDTSEVLTLADLESWSRPGTWLAVLGHPIKHSISPAMHNAALADLARAQPSFATWRYVRFDVPPEDLPRALDLLHARRFQGVNLTVPHKVMAFPLVAEIDAAARPVGAINTLRWSPGGWHGFNTDGYGLATGVHESLGRSLTGAAVILLGAGGAARGAAVECLQRPCASLWVANRTRENLQLLFDALSPLARHVPFHGFVPGVPPHDLPADAIVINATSAGLRESDPAPIDLAALPRPAAVFDMIYNPAETRLLRQAAFLGLPHANGLGMLVHQGAKALEIWTGVPATRTAPTMAAAAHAALNPQPVSPPKETDTSPRRPPRPQPYAGLDD